MALQDDIVAALQADATLAGLLPGGIYDAVEISRTSPETAGAFDENGEILPCCLVKVETQTTIAPYERGSREYLALYLYQRFGYDTIRDAADRIFDLLNRKKISANVWEIRYASSTPDTRDDALDCSLVLSRYEVIRHR